MSVDGVTHTLKQPFLVIATQNPVDHEGTFPLPEAQLDRFLMKFSLGYPTVEEELRMLKLLSKSHPLDKLKPVATAEELVDAQRQVREIQVDQKVQEYLLQIVHDSRQHEALALGGSPRASIALYRSGQAMAAVLGRDYVIPDDIKKVVSSVMCHRLILKPESRLRKVTTEKVLDDIVSEIAVPAIRQTAQT